MQSNRLSTKNEPHIALNLLNTHSHNLNLQAGLAHGRKLSGKITKLARNVSSSLQEAYATATGAPINHHSHDWTPCSTGLNSSFPSPSPVVRNSHFSERDWVFEEPEEIKFKRVPQITVCRYCYCKILTKIEFKIGRGGMMAGFFTFSVCFLSCFCLVMPILFIALGVGKVYTHLNVEYLEQLEHVHVESGGEKHEMRQFNNFEGLGFDENENIRLTESQQNKLINLDQLNQEFADLFENFYVILSLPSIVIGGLFAVVSLVFNKDVVHWVVLPMV